MFTGIIEAVGTLTAMQRQGDDMTLTVHAPGLDFSDVKLGDSIATNGVCLTVVSLGDHSYSADLSLETLSRTRFAEAKVGDTVNLEKALLPTTRLGGHLVSGHVDGIGVVKSKSSSGRAIEYWIAAPEELARYITEKGSIAVDGISLTVNGVKGREFRLTIVPHTALETTIAQWKPGTRVNLEVDQIARYLERLMQGRAESGSTLTLEKLAQSGFL
ncbi:riboflavin synthase [Aeromonas simiae]|uniref:Riboflavin synthase n=1 Tax=Aeromonas simiae TaxID=218936 RepID=A0A5J6WUM7_9GAMM|nr:riboflavin synthase [Aeromonas simiae]QFI53964.1 riboflavin synthase [Aeromonas simiae]